MVRSITAEAGTAEELRARSKEVPGGLLVAREEATTLECLLSHGIT